MSNDRRQHTLEVLRHATESVLSKPQQKSTSSTSDSLNDQAREAALRLLSVRSRSSKELADRLQSKGFPTDIVDDLIERFERVDLLNDERFAHEWVSSRSRHSGRGKAVLRQELRHKGIAPSIIEAELENLSPCVEEDTARALVSRKVKLIDAASLIGWEFFQKQQRRLYSMLVRRGFSSELAQRIVNEALVAHREGYDSN